jgi:hypothetical protein
MTARDYLNELSKKRIEADDDKSAQGKKRSNRLSRRWSLAFTATREGVESADLLRSLTENLIYDWALPDDKVKTFMEAFSVMWHDAEDDKGNETVTRHWSRRWSLVYSAVNDGAKSVRQLQNLLENLSHQWMLPDDKVKTFREAVSVEWHDAEANKDTSRQDEILTKRLSRRWSLVHTAVNAGVGSVEDMQHLLLHLTHNWKLSDGNVKTFNEAASVEWHDAEDLNDSTTQQLSRRWSDIYIKIGKGCSSVKKLQRELNMTITDDMDGNYDDYIVDATSLSGMSRKSVASSTPSSQLASDDVTLTSAFAPAEQSEQSPAATTQMNTVRLEEAEWFCVLDDQSFGPVNRLQFANMARFGIVDANTLVWKSGMPQWALASTVVKLQNVI